MTTMWDESYPPSVFGPLVPPVIPITGVTAGTPGTFVPANATLPANLAALQAHSVVGNAGTNKPGPVPWTVGQFVVLGDASQAHWNAAWAVGAAPVVFVEDVEDVPETRSKRKETRAREDD